MWSGGEREHDTQSIDSKFKCASKFKILLQILLKLHLYFYKTHTILQDFKIYIFGLQCQLSEGHFFF